jgi:hypothetical protein
MPTARSMRLSRTSIPSPGTQRVRDETAWGRLRRRLADLEKPYPCIGVATVGLQIPGAVLMLTDQLLASQRPSSATTSFSKCHSRGSLADYPGQPGKPGLKRSPHHVEREILAFRSIKPFQASQAFSLLMQTTCQRFSSQQPNSLARTSFTRASCLKALNVIDRLPRDPGKSSKKTLNRSYFSASSPAISK